MHKATKPNQNESFFISHDREADHPDVLAGLPLRGRNQWPEGLPGLREDMTAYFRALGAMCDRMLPPFAVALGMPADFFAPFFANEGHANLRFLHYPPQEDIEREHVWHRAAYRQQLHDRAGAHRRAWSGDPAAEWRLVPAAGDTWDIPGEPRATSCGVGRTIGSCPRHMV